MTTIIRRGTLADGTPGSGQPSGQPPPAGGGGPAQGRRKAPSSSQVNIVVVPDPAPDVEIKVSLSLNNVSLFDALRYVVRLQCQFEENGRPRQPGR